MLERVLTGIAVALCGGAGSFAVARWSSYQKRQDDERADLAKRLKTIEDQLILVGAQVLPISTAFQAILVKELTHYHTPELDALLVKLGPPFTLTEAEMQQMFQLLVAREQDLGPLISAAERDAAHMLPLVMRRAKVEAELLGNPGPRFKIVHAIITPGDKP